jgi:hypothetical protein
MTAVKLLLEWEGCNKGFNCEDLLIARVVRSTRSVITSAHQTPCLRPLIMPRVCKAHIVHFTTSPCAIAVCSCSCCCRVCVHYVQLLGRADSHGHYILEFYSIDMMPLDTLALPKASSENVLYSDARLHTSKMPNRAADSWLPVKVLLGVPAGR